MPAAAMFAYWYLKLLALLLAFGASCITMLRQQVALEFVVLPLHAISVLGLAVDTASCPCHHATVLSPLLCHPVTGCDRRIYTLAWCYKAHKTRAATELRSNIVCCYP